jgi:hypothetical protein
MAEAVAKANSPVLTDTYAQKTAQRLGVATESVRAEFKKGGRPLPFVPPADDEPPAEAQPEKVVPPSTREFWFLRYLLAGEQEQVNWLRRHLIWDWIAHVQVRQIAAARFQMLDHNTWHGVPSLLDHFEENSIQELITSAAAEDLPTRDIDKNIQQTLLNIRNDWIDARLAQLTQKFGQTGLTESELIEIAQEKKNLHALKKGPLISKEEPLVDPVASAEQVP